MSHQIPFTAATTLSFFANSLHRLNAVINAGGDVQYCILFVHSTETAQVSNLLKQGIQVNESYKRLQHFVTRLKDLECFRKVMEHFLMFIILYKMTLQIC